MRKFIIDIARKTVKNVSPSIETGRITRIGQLENSYDIMLDNYRYLQDVTGSGSYKVGDNVILSGTVGGSNRAWTILQKTGKKTVRKITIYV